MLKFELAVWCAGRPVVSSEVNTLGDGLGEDGAKGRVEVDKFCFCEVVVSINVNCCFGGGECFVEDDRSFLSEADGLD